MKMVEVSHTNRRQQDPTSDSRFHVEASGSTSVHPPAQPDGEVNKSSNRARQAEVHWWDDTSGLLMDRLEGRESHLRLGDDVASWRFLS